MWRIGAGMFLVLGMVASGLRAEVAAPGTVPGLKVDGEKFKFDDGTLKFDGLLFKPEGKGPFPAMIISHGLGGSPENFGRPKAAVMVKWGYVCIAPTYTFTDKDSEKRNWGASPENLRRAAKCVDILASLPEVDAKRLCAYGNSMGALVTIGLAAQEPERLAAAAITAGGIVDRPARAAPSKEVAQKIRTPFLILQGDKDTTCPPEQSALLEEVLKANKVECERVLFPGVGHDLHVVKAAEVNAKIEAWFKKYAAGK